MHSMVAFPPKSRSLNTVSPLAPGRCHQAIQSIKQICEKLGPGDFPKMGPLFVFAVWVASRSMIILWTLELEEEALAAPPELSTLRNTLRSLAIYWPCAENLSAIIDFVLEESDRPGDHAVLSVFNDVSRTAYGLRNALGEEATRSRAMQAARLWESYPLSGMEDIAYLM